LSTSALRLYFLVAIHSTKMATKGATKEHKINKRPKDDQSDDDEQKEADESLRYELGYWKIQGLASAARMMLVFADVPFRNKMYSVTTKQGGKAMMGQYNLDDWVDVKFQKDLDFPNLPHFIDHHTGFRLTQAKSIYRYIAREFKIGVQADPHLAVADCVLEMVGQVMGVDFPLSRSAPFIYFSYDGFGDNSTDKEWAEKKKKYIEDMGNAKEPVGGCLKQLEEFMANKKFVTGYDISYADFCLYYLCVTHDKLDENFLERFPNLAAFFRRMGALEGMKRWHQTKMAQLPFNNVMAKFK